MPALTEPIDKVRLKVGDTDMTDPLLTDDEVLTHIAAWPDNADLAAADAAEAIAARFARDYSFQTATGQRFDRRERVAHYMGLAETLRKRGGTFVWPTPPGRRLTLRWDLG